MSSALQNNDAQERSGKPALRMPQGFNGIKVGGTVGGVDSENDARKMF